METTHTPGPWYSRAAAGNHDVLVYSETDGRDIAIVRGYREASGNASLIAAAPELLAAACEIIRTMKPNNAAEVAARELLRSAVERAYGQ